MSAGRDLDLLAVDARLREAARNVVRFRRALRSLTRPEVPALRSLGLSHELRVALRERASSDALAAALLPWLLALLCEEGTAAKRAELALAWRVERQRAETPIDALMTRSELLGAALSDSARRRAYLESFTRVAQPVSDRVVELWQLRAEVARQAGVALESIELAAEHLPAAAEAWLARSAAAYEELGVRDLADLIGVALGERYGEGWPAQLNPRALSDLLADGDWFRGLRLDVGRLPRALGASSFLRALAQVGRAWRDAATHPRVPFALGQAPSGLERQGHGALFGLLPLWPEFARRRLGLGRPRLREHLRGMLQSVLVESRLLALRVLLREPALAGTNPLRRAFPELALRALRLELPSSLAGVVIHLHPDDSARFAGLLLGLEQAQLLTEEHDEDWFRNPRAIEDLRERARQGPWLRASEAALAQGARQLERLLGEYG